MGRMCREALPVSRDLGQTGATTHRIGGADIPHQSDPFAEADEPIAPIALAAMQPDASRAGIGVVIIVPSLAHCRDRCPRDVECLHAVRIDRPVLRPAIVGEMADKPVPMVGDCDTRGDAHKRWPSDPK